MKLRISHETTYRYDRPIRNLIQSLRLTPSIYEGQKVLQWQIDLPGGLRGPGFRDGAGDWIEGWTLRGPAAEITVRIEGRVDTRDTAGVLRGHREVIHPLAYMRATSVTRADPGLRDLAASVQAGPDLLDLSHGLSRAVNDAIAFRPGVTESHTTAAEALALGEGVCQDHTHALIAVARERGIPARYVSGYLHSTIDGEPHDAAHAWAELHVQGLGWVGFDAANRCCPDERYVRLGSGLNASDAAPIRGVATGSGGEELDVRVQVEEMSQ
ncbi:transglutaminase family protein [Paracoccus sp. 1_MG-2023]|uniref:transglutaminase family protein n=1 Tax=unclassified Paracoccus (in: a-proteobacteria) TaxID=2688777 RepID=UPI001C088013|nr:MULTISPECIES: transglutaminase family protein [unclassified Paracoccus (in: a-proteobacteria)]MBU2957323.1 transglutaminase family protein [Paracoccus sp. C2R09]MDO6669909.1 transglutaminase family protein [Paracoccus sp. 1_MG-2023]